MSKPIPTPLPRIAATYARVSTLVQDSGDKTSLDTQEAGCQQWATLHAWAIDPDLAYRDRHSGEELWERPALTRLREAARARRFGVLVCHSIDRLSRDPIHLGILIDELTRLGIAVQFVTEELDDTPEAALIRFIKGYAGKVENERRRERQMRATRARAERGRLVATGRVPFGYRWADASKSALVEDPDTAPIVRRIFKDYAGGMTLRELAATLTADGVPTATGRTTIWDPAVVRNLLKTSLYWGEPVTLKTRSERIPPDQRAFYRNKRRVVARDSDDQIKLPADVAPALISPALAYEVQQRLHLNQQLATRSAKDPESALLRGIARCGICNGSIHANRIPSQRRADGSVPVRYVCRNALKVRRDQGGYCKPHSLDAGTVDRLVWEQVANVLRDPRVIQQELERMRTSTPPGAADLAAVDGRLVSLSQRMRSLMDTAQYVTDPEARKDLAAQIDILSKEKRKAEGERAQLVTLAAQWDQERADLETLTAQCERVADVIDTWSYAEKRAALVALKAEVTLHAPGHTPRVELGIKILRGGRIPLALSMPAPVASSTSVVNSVM